MQGRDPTMAESVTLIVNADDFGRSDAVNRGVIAGHARGVVTSASLMVRWPAAAAAVAAAREFPGLSLGLHLDLGEWVYRGGEWVAAYEVVPVGDPAAVAAEAARQLDAFRRLTGRDPTHLDSHQHVHRREPARSALSALAGALAVPLRHFDPHVRYCGDFYGQTGTGEPLPGAVGVDALLAVVAALPPGVTELACHPADGVDFDTTYGRERVEELAALCDPRVRSALAERGVRLVSFGELRSERNG
jgi:predicted glycoside hydrolase/deacetylase ChbG (UPF0249 family)